MKDPVKSGKAELAKQMTASRGFTTDVVQGTSAEHLNTMRNKD